ncbi:LOW QUALITY PROTEIN: kinesin-like protein KIF25 [Heterocephalus glaber]|uniref:LOW QUALITY PROTEIN: kinesin-like protein KIF25 n=1 Tax=Heterocephalus glaber TaxID=10181 RepID=A0AAX6R9X7_HETGA|nr:LOW QUALITY PROTEIN: kinesin-like protein KIF25 [Heterocephalus glaber]
MRKHEHWLCWTLLCVCVCVCVVVVMLPQASVCRCKWLLPRPLMYHFTLSLRVYGPAEPQTAVFADVCPLLTSLLGGCNMCIMAYGQMGSGKSYTMLRSGLPSDAHSDLGIIPRAVEELFRLILENQSGIPNVDVSIVEIYNSDIFDLAKHNSTVASGVKCEVVTTQDGRTEVLLLTRRGVGQSQKFVELVHGGLQLRARNPTLVHADHSRSHPIIMVTLTAATSLASIGELPFALGQFQCRKEIHSPRNTLWGCRIKGILMDLRIGIAAVPSNDLASKASRISFYFRQPGQTLSGERTGTGKSWSSAHQASPGPMPLDPVGCMKQVWSRLQLVHLAGSECAGVSGVTGLALTETLFINRSISALADVLATLSERRGHIPYRNSKLTYLLQDSIRGDAKLLVILCVSPEQKHMAETLQSLGFGTRAWQVKRGQARKKPPHSQMRELCLGSA